MLFLSITFDYELYMGQNYVSEKEVLIEPTSKLGNMLSIAGVSATFFADVCCPIRYREFGNSTFAELFDKQLKELTAQGQDVQLHIHPHWLKATKIGKNVEFDRCYYRIHNWAEENDYTNVEEIIANGADYLNRLLGTENKNYRCLAFRAGGYCLQPEKQLVPILYRHGIKIDSSVCRGFSHEGDGMYYDYKSCPRSVNLYLNENVGLADECKTKVPNGILEVPVGGYSVFPFRQIASKLNAPISNRAATGYYMALEKKVAPKKTVRQQIDQMLHGTNMLTFDFYNARSLIFMLEMMSREEPYRNNDAYVAIIAHPKGMSDEHIENMSSVIDYFKRNKKVEFVSMRQIADKLGL